MCRPDCYSGKHEFVSPEQNGGRNKGECEKRNSPHSENHKTFVVVVITKQRNVLYVLPFVECFCSCVFH